jgi:UDP:flavonoid glycosyltransferase YjiC (YdhE family)
MYKVAFVAHSAHGHINPSLGMAKALVDRGVDLFYCATPDFKSQVEAQGARFHSFTYSDEFVHFFHEFHHEVVDAFDVAGASYLMAEVADHVLGQVMPILREEKPDLIIYDVFSFTGR